MRSRTFLKPCPFCGAAVELKYGINNVTFFLCTNDKCLALVSFGGDKIVERGTVEARDPIANFNRRNEDVKNNKGIP